MNEKKFVYAVFDADGYECKTFVGAFSTPERAERAAAVLRVSATAEFDELKLRLNDSSLEDARTISVEVVELDVEV